MESCRVSENLSPRKKLRLVPSSLDGNTPPTQAYHSSLSTTNRLAQVRVSSTGQWAQDLWQKEQSEQEHLRLLTFEFD